MSIEHVRIIICSLRFIFIILYPYTNIFGMKKIIIILSISLSLISSNNAQNLKIEIGGGHSWQIDEYEGESIIDSKFKLCYQAGLTNEFELPKSSSIKTGVFFEHNGRKESIALYENNYDGKIKIWYLNVPFSYKYNFNINNTAYFFELGMFGGCALFGKVKYPSMQNGVVVTETEKLEFGKNAGLTRFDYGIISAVGVTIANIDFSLKYQHGIQDVNKTEKRTNKNRSVMISCGIPL